MPYPHSRNNSGHPISTFGRYLYLNTYAFLILGMGTGIVLLPLGGIWKYFIYIQIILAVVCLSAACSIFKSWDIKKRKYDVLVERNREEFTPGTFRVFMRAPCGVLLVKTVLKDLGQQEQYRQLRQYRRPLWKFLTVSLRRKKTVAYKKTF